MLNQYNPFKENRAEQMRDLWKYYVPFPGLDGAGKPIVVQGGRGSGKTMFFQCNSWRQVLSKIRKTEQTSSKLFDYDFIGIYYRVDTTFVSSMCDREEDDWNAIFETYLSICIVQEIVDLIITLSKDMPIKENELSFFISDFSKRFNPKSTVNSLASFRQETDIYLNFIEDQINGLGSKDSTDLRWVTAHRLISDICNSCNKLFCREILFKIFIDEYETLQLYQQKIVNTLIKHSTLPVIFNIGLRPKGMKTRETISKTETIEEPHDFEMLTLEISSEDYLKILREICQKRISLGKEQGKIPSTAPDEIDFYLGSYRVDDEIEQLTRTSSTNVIYLKNLKEVIQRTGIEQKIPQILIKKYIEELCDKAPMLNSRLHYALLCQNTPYTPLLKDLYEAYIKKNSRYEDWMHNRKFGLVFLLCKEFKKEKMYYGFEVYAALSSSIVRYFLELCEQAFRIAFLDDYCWDKRISPEIQTEAARYVGEYKVTDIAGYEPYGKELRIFIQYLGQIFYRLHTAELSTLGEPEPNHFSTKDLALSDSTKVLISSAIMWTVLQEGEPTKRKQSRLSPETVDYYMNKIYVPYFGISYRNQRKISVSVDILDQLLSGNDEIAKIGFRNYFKYNQELATLANEHAKQMTISDVEQGVKND